MTSGPLSFPISSSIFATNYEITCILLREMLQKMIEMKMKYSSQKMIISSNLVDYYLMFIN